MSTTHAADHVLEGLVCHEYDCEDLGVGLECWFEVTPAERGARERGSGLQLEPDYPETWVLCHTYLPDSGVDITPVMYSKLVDQIEAWAFENFGEWP